MQILQKERKHWQSLENCLKLSKQDYNNSRGNKTVETKSACPTRSLEFWFSDKTVALGRKTSKWVIERNWVCLKRDYLQRKSRWKVYWGRVVHGAVQCSVCHMSKFHPHVCWSQHDRPGVPGALLVTNLDCVDGSGLTGLLPPPRVSGLKRGSGSGSADAGASVRGNWCQRLLEMWTCVIFGPLLLNTL